MSTHLQQQTQLLNKFINTHSSPPPSTPPIPSPPVTQHVPPLESAGTDMGITDFMDESTPGENKRQPATESPSLPVTDLQQFMTFLDEIDKKLPSSSLGDDTELTQNKTCLVSLRKDIIRLYNHTFHKAAKWKTTKQKKNKPNTRSSLKQACNESGHVQPSS